MSIQRQLEAFVVREFLFTEDTMNLGADDDLLDKGIVDSMGVAQIVRFMEETFGIRIDDADNKSSTRPAVDCSRNGKVSIGRSSTIQSTRWRIRRYPSC